MILHFVNKIEKHKKNSKKFAIFLCVYRILLRDLECIINARVVQKNEMFGERFDAVASPCNILSLGKGNGLLGLLKGKFFIFIFIF